MRNINHTDFSFTCDISFIGPLEYNNKIKLDFSGREKPIREVKSPSITVYDMEIKIPTLDLTEILAEKIRALIVRGKSRDLYDVWFLLSKNITLDLDLVNEKLKLYDKEFNYNEFCNSISKIENTWSRDLKPLLTSVPKFEIMKETVERFNKEK